MGAAFKARYRRNKETLEWYDALAMAVAIIALVFTFGVRIVKVDGHSMDHTLSAFCLGRRTTVVLSWWAAVATTASGWSSGS